MPRYDYRCPANGCTVEVQHPMRASISSWGELCELAEVDPGDTPTNSPVHKLVTVPAAFARPSNPSGAGGCCGVPGCAPGH